MFCENAFLKIFGGRVYCNKVTSLSLITAKIRQILYVESLYVFSYQYYALRSSSQSFFFSFNSSELEFSSLRRKSCCCVGIRVEMSWFLFLRLRNKVSFSRKDMVFQSDCFHFADMYFLVGVCVSQLPVPAPICIYQPRLQSVFTGPGPQFVFTGPAHQFVFTSL